MYENRELIIYKFLYQKIVFIGNNVLLILMKYFTPNLMHDYLIGNACF
jgi:hypothetical protein